MRPLNGPAQAGRASDVRLPTETRSRPCLQPDGCTAYLASLLVDVISTEAILNSKARPQQSRWWRRSHSGLASQRPPASTINRRHIRRIIKRLALKLVLVKLLVYSLLRRKRTCYWKSK